MADRSGITPKQKRYHHGNLRSELIEAAIVLISKNGVHALSLREAARQAEVSSGAPYRHFADKEALLQAIADDGNRRLTEVIADELSRAAGNSLEAFRARGIAFVRFAAANPVHFRLMCSPTVGGSEDVTSELTALVSALPNLEHRAGRVALAGQALSYGLARMIVDEQIELEDRSPEAIRELAISILDVFGEGIASAQPSG